MPTTATVRVHPQTQEALRRLAAAHATTIPEVLRELVARAEDDELLSGVEADFAGLARDPDQLADYQAEVAAWDATLLDGLENDPWQ
ncbi:MAG: hypothetical protein ACRDL5_12255 [Solirubrobacteraceae bacterium]